MMAVEFYDVTVKGESEKGSSDSGALLCVIEGEEVWIPKSQITEDSEVYSMDTEGTLVITDWIAEKKGLV
jgi:hypothetical protein